MKQNINVTSMEVKTSKNGQEYAAIESTQGKFSCWDMNEAKFLTTGENNLCEVAVKGNFRNIVNVARHEIPQNSPTTQQPAAVIATASSEPFFRINLKQMATGKTNWEITIRADSTQEAEVRLSQAVKLAQDKCNTLNAEQAATPASAPKVEAGQ